LGIGDWGLGIGDWAQSPIPNPQSPIPNPQYLNNNNFINFNIYNYFLNENKLFIKIIIIINNKSN
jgi:hypothetical protein